MMRRGDLHVIISDALYLQFHEYSSEKAWMAIGNLDQNILFTLAKQFTVSDILPAYI